MSIPIFWRLILGTMGILFLSVAACLYSIVQLGTLSRTARAALDVDQRMINYQEGLTDAFLSEVRYGGKYIITHTEDRHEQLRQFKNDFARYLGELKSLMQSNEIAASVSRVEQIHLQYHELFDREAAYIRANQTYAQSRYQQERDKVFESALSELARLKTLLQSNLQDRLEGIDRAARTARQVAMLSTLIVTLLGTLFSLKISSSIAAPLKQYALSAQTEFAQLGDSRWSAAELRATDGLSGAREREEQKLTDGASVKPLLKRLTILAGNTMTTLSRRRWQKPRDSEKRMINEDQF